MQSGIMSIPRYIENLQAKGRYSFSYQDIVTGTGKSEKAVERALSRLRPQGAIASPRKGFYLIIPPEYRVAGCLPATWFIDDMMKFAKERYYVGLLSAAELFGAAHHSPQEFQVITEHSHRGVQCGRTKIRFFSKRYLTLTPTTTHKTRTGYMQISTPEATALDLVRYSFELGGLSSVAVVISELAERLKARELVRTAPGFELSIVQRLGFVLDKLNMQKLSDPLSRWLLDQQPRVVSLHNRRSSADAVNISDRWRINVNEEFAIEA